MTRTVRTAAILQARLGSVRLPGKVLLPINGRPMLAHVIERARRIEGIDDLIVAVPSCDVELAQLARSCGAKVYLGSAFDVLSRYHWAAKWFSVDVIVRLTADCPMLDPYISSQVVARFQRGGFDYLSNVVTRPNGDTTDGLDTEVFTARALTTAFCSAEPGRDREHVTTFIRERPREFRVGTLPVGLHKGRWSVDTADDLAKVRGMLAA